MSELRNSTPPVPPMSGDETPTEAQPHVTAAKPKTPRKAPISAAKASKATKATPIASSPTARTNAKGATLRCQVGSGARQCNNPGRWPHGKGFTCTTHHKAIVRGRSLEVKGNANALYIAPVSSKAATKAS